MAKEAVLNVYLMGGTKEPEKIVGVAIRRCYSGIPSIELKKNLSSEKINELVEMVNSVGHTSTTEHAVFNFAVEGLSRIASHQLVRHRLASYSQESQRYVVQDKKGFSYIMPPSIRNNEKLAEKFRHKMDEDENFYRELLDGGIKAEDARFALPHNAETKVVLTMNARELNETFFPQRLCRRAQWEVRNMAIGMAKLVRRNSRVLFENIGPTCKTQGICWEGEKSCGLWKVVENGELRLRKKHVFKKGISNDLSFIDE